MAASFACENVLRDCECLPFPVRNFSSETPDVPVFLSNFPGPPIDGGVPPDGPGFFAPGCLGICFSEVSQEEADECAQRQAEQCAGDNNVPVPAQIYSNTLQSCTVLCPDGSTFNWLVPPGTVQSRWQADADARAQALACKRAMSHRICFLTEQNLASVCINELMSVVFDVVGGSEPFAFSIIAGSIPLGTALNEQGNLFGTPTSSGPSTFTIQVTDAIGSTQFKEFTLNVVAITSPTALPGATQGSAYSYTLLANGTTGTPTWSLVSGALPGGLTLSGATISGTPTESGSFNFEMQIVDTRGAICAKAFTLEVEALPVPTFYWTLDDTLNDSIAALPMTAGLLNYDTGIINDGFRFIPSINSEVDLGTGATASIPYTAGQHLSFSWWMNWAVGFDANDQIQVRFEGGGNSITVTWLNSGLVRLRVSNGISSSFVDTAFTLTLGQWDFFTVVYDATTGLATLYLNSAVFAVTGALVGLLTSASNSITFRQIGGFGGAALDFVVDESGWWFNTALSASQVSELYNGGGGSRPPGV